jgi:hypothetical protein
MWEDRDVLAHSRDSRLCRLYVKVAVMIEMLDIMVMDFHVIVWKLEDRMLRACVD